MARRIEAMLATIEEKPFASETLQAMRCFEILERLGTRKARRLLDTLAAVSPRTWINWEAEAALRRFRTLPAAPQSRSGQPPSGPEKIVASAPWGR